ncbi:MAG: hypothetical protein A2Z18_08060 [Armatimonadetes bacterium RBG_16_58_9]|nr:MAG: hypothetical protein A2Z18_08060 [Armatimonadetes bacterium RBG_16_58_9]
MYLAADPPAARFYAAERTTRAVLSSSSGVSAFEEDVPKVPEVPVFGDFGGSPGVVFTPRGRFSVNLESRFFAQVPAADF